jgi:hypothetical protein
MEQLELEKSDTKTKHLFASRTSILGSMIGGQGRLRCDWLINFKVAPLGLLNKLE